MINPSNLQPPLVALSGVTPQPSAARSAHAASPASWFDSSSVSEGARISADLDPASRGLSVEQHAARVLQHLCAERDEGA
jgi:hypothetical protein